MLKQQEKKRSARGELHLCLAPADQAQAELPHLLRYRPALMFECQIEFRDIRAELIHAKEAYYSAWLPDGGEDVVIDWSEPAVPEISPDRLEWEPRSSICPYPGKVRLTKRRMDQAQSDLMSYLIRQANLTLYHNPSLQWYSKLGEDRQEFLNRVADEVLTQMQPQLKMLAQRLKFRLEQLRELSLQGDYAQDVSDELEVVRRRMISLLENRMEAAIMSHPQAPTTPLLDTADILEIPDELKNLQEELRHIEQDFMQDLHAIHAEYHAKVNDCHEYPVRLQPTDIKVIRRALLWVPV